MKTIRRSPIAFGPVTVPAGSTMRLQVRSEELFTIERLVIPSTIAPEFIIHSLTVDDKEQLLSSNPVSANCFVETAIDTFFSFPAGTRFGLTVQHIPTRGRVTCRVKDEWLIRVLRSRRVPGKRRKLLIDIPIKELPFQLQPLHPRHHPVFHEVDFYFDSTWKIPRWVDWEWTSNEHGRFIGAASGVSAL